MSSHPHIPDRFARTILTHAMAAAVNPQHALLLFVQGHPGDGKSWQTKRVLEEGGFEPTVISSTEFSGGYEGDAKEALRNTYSLAHQIYRTPGGRRPYPAIVLEDFDLSVASARSNSAYTVNSQLFTGFLMNLAEDVREAKIPDCTDRFPIFLTGNNLQNLYGPLVRPGRADFFEWIPSPEERASILYGMLGSILVHDQQAISRQAIDWLQQQYPHLSISTFRAALDHMIANHLYSRLSPAVGFDPVAGERIFHEARTLRYRLSDYRQVLNEYRDGKRQAGNYLQEPVR